MSATETDLTGGIDLGGTKIQSAIIRRDGEVLGQARQPTPTSGGPEDVTDAMAACLRGAAKDAAVELSSLTGVGIGSPGSVDEKTGTVSGAGNLPGWGGSFPMGETLSKNFGVPVKIGNDVQVATEAEFHLGAAKPYQSLIGVFWGTGVGGGLVLGGKPWIGRGAAGEIGHIVVEIDGARCPCGRRGCLEAYAGRSAMEAKARREHEKGEKTDLFKLMKHHGKDRLTSGIWQRALDQGDKLAEKLIDRAVWALGAGVASAVNLLDPEAVVLGGGLGVRLGDPFLDRIVEKAHEHLFVPDHPPFMHVASLGDLGGAIGASMLITPIGPTSSEAGSKSWAPLAGR